MPPRRFTWCATAQEALDYAFSTGSFADRAAGNPQLILLDKKLPAVDGMEVLRQLRADPRTCLIPIVMLKGSAEESDMTESYQLGANSYIVKPMDFNKFTETARHLGYYWLLINQAPPDALPPMMPGPINPSRG